MKIRLTKSEGGSDGKEGAKKLEIMTIQEYGKMKKKKMKTRLKEEKETFQSSSFFNGLLLLRFQFRSS